MTCTCCQPLADAQRVDYPSSIFGIHFPFRVEPTIFTFGATPAYVPPDLIPRPPTIPAQCVPWPTLSLFGWFSSERDGVNPFSATPPTVIPVSPLVVPTTRVEFWMTLVPSGRSAWVASIPVSITSTEKSPLPATGIPPLRSEVERARSELHAVAARLASGDSETPLRLAEIEALLESDAFVIDACRRSVVAGKSSVSLVSRPVLFELALALGVAAPGEVTRDVLIAAAFGARRINDSHRARLRVEIGRLRHALASMAELCATPNGFALIPRRAARVVRLLPPSESETSALSALLARGEPWSSSALAAALGKSQRSVQRALLELQAAGRVRALGKGRAQRWLAPESTGITTAMLLVARGALG